MPEQLRDRRVTREIIDDINAQIQRFLLVRLVTAVIVAVATWAVLAWLGVQQAAVWGILAGVFNSIPYFGPLVVSGGLLLVGLVQFGDLMQAVKVSAAALAITSLEGWLLTPPLLGKAEHMHPLVVFVGVLVWTWIWGASATAERVRHLPCICCDRQVGLGNGLAADPHFTDIVVAALFVSHADTDEPRQPQSGAATTRAGGHR